MAKKNIRKRLGDRIRQLRKERNLSQERLAERADLNAKYLGAVERGERNPSFESLFKIAGALGISLAFLLQFEARPPVKRKDEAEEIFWKINELLSGKDKKSLKTALHLLSVHFDEKI